MVYIGLILIVVSFACYAVQWKLQFHFKKSIFSTFKNQQFWNPEISWENKWKKGTNNTVPKFFGSTKFFVFVTDAFHLFQSIFLNSFILGASLIQGNQNWYWYFAGIRLVYSIVFNLFFDVVLKKKQG